MRKIRMAGVLLLLMLAGCGQAGMMNALAPSAQQKTARGYLDLLREHKFDQLEKSLDVSLQTPDAHEKLVQLASAFPQATPVSVKLVGLYVSNRSGVVDRNMTFEYQFPERWVVASVALREQAGVTDIIGMHGQALTESLENINRFHLGGKRAIQYGVLALAVLSAMLTVFALVLCARAHIARRKWLWILFILVGFGKLSVNWTSGQWGFMPLSLQLFSVSVVSRFYGPWIVSVSAPLGAIWFLLRRKYLVVSPPVFPPMPPARER